MIHFLTSTLADARTSGCDTVQIKYDGMFAQFAAGNGRVIIRDNLRFAEKTVEGVDPDVNCVLIGAYHPRMSKFYIFDCWCVTEPPGNTIDLRREPYRSRYVAAKIQMKLLKVPDTFHLVQNHPISHAEALWRNLPEVTNGKGLVFRNSHDPVGVQVRYARWYQELPGELV